MNSPFEEQPQNSFSWRIVVMGIAIGLVVVFAILTYQLIYLPSTLPNTPTASTSTSSAQSIATATPTQPAVSSPPVVTTTENPSKKQLSPASNQTGTYYVRDASGKTDSETLVFNSRMFENWSRVATPDLIPGVTYFQTDDASPVFIKVTAQGNDPKEIEKYQTNRQGSDYTKTTPMFLPTGGEAFKYECNAFACFGAMLDQYDLYGKKVEPLFVTTKWEFTTTDPVTNKAAGNGAIKTMYNADDLWDIMRTAEGYTQ